jgi:hypothetical protein
VQDAAVEDSCSQCSYEPVEERETSLAQGFKSAGIWFTLISAQHITIEKRRDAPRIAVFMITHYHMRKREK